ncbi:hypothetical protein GGD81_004624 [Rhodobium orientis]|uniref:Uncharacterized protein n=1 Tax=Rhodobium orientis TaxID=34017 RepID=A0A327JH90_9HYPH|nr:hypothetical protein [Rhodobium orientis]MBB4305544.1 hypothetical protein [Rhodobium orientis]MBK5949140.1 hypothetical protein [Rhodobium orientis]RAI24683.1 hypothetical protein CH339_21665 [Rhodobium orientis]
MLKLVLSWLTGGVADRLVDAYRAKLEASNDAERIAADVRIKKLEARRDLALAESGYFWSATRLGRLLFAVPLGLWYAAGVLDSIFFFDWNVAALPPQFWSIAEIVIPSLFLSETAQIGLRYWGRKA